MCSKIGSFQSTAAIYKKLCIKELYLFVLRQGQSERSFQQAAPRHTQSHIHTHTHTRTHAHTSPKLALNWAYSGMRPCIWSVVRLCSESSWDERNFKLQDSYSNQDGDFLPF